MKSTKTVPSMIAAGLLLALYTSSGSAAPTAGGLAMPPSWMPADWDRNVFPGNDVNLDARNRADFQKTMLNTTPFILWAVAHNASITESYTPVWAWTTGIRSCARGGQMVDDLSGEFGDRNRGVAALVQARKEFAAWAATQPSDITMYFAAQLGTWNQATSSFSLQNLDLATTFPVAQAERDGTVWDGASVHLWGDQNGQAISDIQATLTAPACMSKDGRTRYRFERQSQWWVTFGDAYIGYGGITSYRKRAFLPPIRMSRDAAAAFAQRNPQRKVEMSVTFVPAGRGFNNGRNQFFTPAKYKKIEIVDAVTRAVLVSQNY